MFINPTVLCTILLSLTVDAFKTPRPITALLSAAETEEIKRDRFSLGSRESVVKAERFTSLMKPVHASMFHHGDTPKCLGSNQSDEWKSYDSKCSYSLTPSEYCCQVYAEQACADPRWSTSQATTVVNERINGLGGAANPFLYDKCMIDNCSAACSESNGSDAACKMCSSVCQRSCLANLLHICMKRTCGQSIMSLSERALAHNPTSPEHALHEQTENDVRHKLRLSKKDVRSIERSEIVNYALSMMEAGAAAPLCTNDQLIRSDNAAEVVVEAASGMTFVQALVACTKQYLSPEMLPKIMNNPKILMTSMECSVVASCERDHVKLAMDRAEYQLQVIKKKRKMAAQGFL